MDYTFGDDAVDEIEAMLRKEQARGGLARPTFGSGQVDNDDGDSDDDYSDDFDVSVAGRSAAGQSTAGRRSEIEEEVLQSDAPPVVPPLLMGPDGGRPADPDTSHYPPVVPHDGHAPTVRSQRSSRHSGDRSARHSGAAVQRSIPEDVPKSYDDRVRDRTQGSKRNLASKGSRHSVRNGGAPGTKTSARKPAAASGAGSARKSGKLSHRQKRLADAAKRRADTLRKLQTENQDLQAQVQVLRDRLDAAQAAAHAREERQRKVRLGLGRDAGSPRATDLMDSSMLDSGNVDVELLEHEMKLRDIDEVLDQANDALVEASAENALLKHQADAGVETSVVHQVKAVMSQIRNLDRRIKRLRADNKGIEDINRHQQLALDSALQHAHAKKHEDVTSQIRELNDEARAIKDSLKARHETLARAARRLRAQQELHMKLKSEARRMEARKRGVGGGLSSRQRREKKRAKGIAKEREELEKKLEALAQQREAHEGHMEKQLAITEGKTAKVRRKVADVLQSIAGCDAQLQTLRGQRDSIKKQIKALKAEQAGHGGSKTSRSLTAGDASSVGDDPTMLSPQSHPGRVGQQDRHGRRRSKRSAARRGGAADDAGAGGGAGVAAEKNSWRKRQVRRASASAEDGASAGRHQPKPPSMPPVSPVQDSAASRPTPHVSTVADGDGSRAETDRTPHPPVSPIVAASSTSKLLAGAAAAGAVVAPAVGGGSDDDDDDDDDGYSDEGFESPRSPVAAADGSSALRRSPIVMPADAVPAHTVPDAAAASDAAPVPAPPQHRDVQQQRRPMRHHSSQESGASGNSSRGSARASTNNLPSSAGAEGKPGGVAEAQVDVTPAASAGELVPAGSAPATAASMGLAGGLSVPSTAQSSMGGTAAGMPSYGSINFALGAGVFDNDSDDGAHATPVAMGSAREIMSESQEDAKRRPSKFAEPNPRPSGDAVNSKQVAAPARGLAGTTVTATGDVHAVTAAANNANDSDGDDYSDEFDDAMF